MFCHGTWKGSGAPGRRGPRLLFAWQPQYLEPPESACRCGRGFCLRGVAASRGSTPPWSRARHANRSRAHGDQARQNPFWRLQVLRLTGAAVRQPGAPEPFLEAPSTAPVTQKYNAATRNGARAKIKIPWLVQLGAWPGGFWLPQRAAPWFLLLFFVY